MTISIPRFDFKRVMYIFGGVGVILWGIGSVIAWISYIVIISIIITTPPPFTSWSIQLYILFSLSIVTYIFFIIAYLIVVIFGVRLLQQKFSWQLAFVFLLIYALAILIASVVLLYVYSQSGVVISLNYGILWLISSIFILIGTFIIQFSKSLSAKITGIIFGLVSITLLMTGYYNSQALFFITLLMAGNRPQALFNLLQIFLLLNPLSPTLGYVAIIYALIIGMVAILLRGSVIWKLILGMIIIAPLLYGISISIDNLGAFSLLTILSDLLSRISEWIEIPPALSMAIGTLNLAAVLGGVGGILIVIGSGLGLGYTVKEGINLLSKFTPTSSQSM